MSNLIKCTNCGWVASTVGELHSGPLYYNVCNRCKTIIQSDIKIKLNVMATDHTYMVRMVYILLVVIAVLLVKCLI